jgi:hypothetical protein
MKTLSFSRMIAITLVTSLGLAGGCSDDGEEPAPTACATNPYACDCEDIAVGVTDRRRCVGTPLCDTNDECPMPIEAGYGALCVDQGDLMVKGFSGRCHIVCAAATCPAGMECLGEYCWFPDDS